MPWASCCDFFVLIVFNLEVEKDLVWFVGGKQTQTAPPTFLRGPASTFFASLTSRPAPLEEAGAPALGRPPLPPRPPRLPMPLGSLLTSNAFPAESDWGVEKVLRSQRLCLFQCIRQAFSGPDGDKVMEYVIRNNALSQTYDNKLQGKVASRKKQVTRKK